jgi:hypothetical protein
MKPGPASRLLWSEAAEVLFSRVMEMGRRRMKEDRTSWQFMMRSAVP